MGGDEQAEEEQQGGSDQKLRGDGKAVVMDVRAGRAAGGAAALDHEACAVGADQMLAAHLKPLR